MTTVLGEVVNSVASNNVGLPFSLPVGWDVRRLKHVAVVRVSNVDKKSVEGEQPVRLCNYVDVYKNDFIHPGMEFMEATATQPQIAKFTLKAGDVLITKDSEEWTDIAVPAYVEADMPGVLCAYHLAHLRPRPGTVDGRFLFRVIGAEGIADQFRVSANGITRFGLSIDDISNALIPIPPISIQRTIAAFLDRKTAKIDEVIAKKQRLVCLLEERRQAIVFAGTTKGLDCTACLVESKDRWVGMVPAHWTRLQLKHAFESIEYGISDSLAATGRYRVVRMGDIQDGAVMYANPGYVDTVDCQLLLETNDLLFNRTNSLEQIAKVGLFRGHRHDEVTFASYLVRLRTGRRADPAFMNYLLNTVPLLGLVRSLALPSINQANLNPTRYGEVHVHLPPLDEQREIVRRLDDECARLRAIGKRIIRQIEILQEYRQTLISAAVTGKLTVPVN